MDETMIKQNKEFTFTYDKEADAAYIYMGTNQQIKVGETYMCDDLPSVTKGEINLDFDNEGLLIGIEILGAGKMLPSNLLKDPQ